MKPRTRVAPGLSSTGSLLPGLAILVALLPVAAAAQQQRYDHHGALGLTVATGGEVVTIITPAGDGSERGVRVPIEVGVTVSVTNRTELRAAGRIAPGIPPLSTLGSSAYLGMRNSFGFEQWKTFFDLDFATHFTPLLTFGARAGFGVQYDFLPIMGAYAQLGAQLGGANGLRLSFELSVGVQFRTYVFE